MCVCVCFVFDLCVCFVFVCFKVLSLVCVLFVIFCVVLIHSLLVSCLAEGQRLREAAAFHATAYSGEGYIPHPPPQFFEGGWNLKNHGNAQMPWLQGVY